MYIQITVAYFGKSGTLEQIKWDSVPLYLISFCDAVIILFSKARPKFFTSWPKCRLQAYVILKKTQTGTNTKRFHSQSTQKLLLVARNCKQM